MGKHFEMSPLFWQLIPRNKDQKLKKFPSFKEFTIDNGHDRLKMSSSIE